MATSYETIYAAALSRFSDYDLLKLADDERDDVMLAHMRSARSDFLPVCNIVGNHDDTAGQYNEDLGDDEIEILALGLAYYWCSSKVLNSELFRNVLNTKDFTFFSPGTLLNSLRSLRDDLRKEYRTRMVTYSYEHGGISNMRVGE